MLLMRGEHAGSNLISKLHPFLAAVRRRRAIHILWITPTLLFIVSVSWSWRPFAMSNRDNRRNEELDPRVSGGTSFADRNQHEASSPSAPSFPAQVNPISRPEFGEYMTGPEIMALKHVPEIEMIGNETASDKQRRPHGSASPQGCADINLDALSEGMTCGPPLGPPCFDHTRCRPPPLGPGPSIYVYDSQCSLENSSELPPSNESLQLSHTWREAAREAGVLSEEYETACLFVQVNKLVDRDPCAVETPLWNGGANHLMVDLTDLTR